MMINFPPNIMLYFKGLIQVATHEFLLTDKWMPTAFSLKVNKPLNDRYLTLDFETKIFILNMGTLYIVFLLFLVEVITYGISIGLKRQNYKCDKLIKYLEGGIIWSNTLDFCNQAYLEIVFAILINVYAFDWSSWGFYLNNISLCFFTGLVLLYPIWV